jgi:hypothetical protein
VLKWELKRPKLLILFYKRIKQSNIGSLLSLRLLRVYIRIIGLIYYINITFRPCHLKSNLFS